MKLFFILFFSGLIFISCQQNKKQCDSCDEEIENILKEEESEEMVMYEPSELAKLMLDMYADNENWKEEVMKGNIPKNFPEEYKNIHTAQSVNGGAGGEFYNAMATSYIHSIEDLTNASPENVKDRFNKMVNVCLSCHHEICPGPIAKINKLLIK